MSTLAQIQSWMQGALHDPHSVDSAQSQQLLRGRDGFDGSQGLAVYQRSFLLRILSCMREQFPALCHALGQGLFDDFVRGYLQTHPPESYTLYDLGRRFPTYLQDTRPDLDAPSGAREVWVDFMIDLARFERQLFVMFDMPGQECKPFARTKTKDADLRLQPCVWVGQFGFRVAQYYHDVRAQKAPLVPSPGASHLLIFRRDYLTHTAVLNPVHFAFLQSMFKGADVAAALAHVAQITGTPLAQLRRAWASETGMRAAWITAGIFIEG